MLRLLVTGLLLSTVRRATFAQSTAHNALLSRTALLSTCRNLNSMEQPFQKMRDEGEPMCDKPSDAAAPKQEEQELPKLSATEFRQYNRLAEHMDMFVCLS